MNIHIGHYDNSQGIGYDGWIEPDDLSWIIFVTTGGDLTIWMEREPTGGVIGDPVRLLNKKSNPHQFDGIDTVHEKKVLQPDLLKQSEEVLRDSQKQQRDIAATLASVEKSKQYTDPILRRAGLLK